MGNVATWLTIVAKPLRFIGAPFGDRQHSPMGLRDRQPNGVLQTTETQVSTCRDVATTPDDFRIESQHSMRPTLIPVHRPLKLPLIDLEQQSLMLCRRRRWLRSISRSEDDVPDSY